MAYIIWMLHVFWRICNYISSKFYSCFISLLCGDTAPLGCVFCNSSKHLRPCTLLLICISILAFITLTFYCSIPKTLAWALLTIIKGHLFLCSLYKRCLAFNLTSCDYIMHGCRGDSGSHTSFQRVCTPSSELNGTWEMSWPDKLSNSPQ